MNNLILRYIIFINIISLTLMLIDKKKALKNKWRITENTFVFLSILMGGLGIILGKELFHHKIHKFKFKYVIPFITIIQFIFLYCIFN